MEWGRLSTCRPIVNRPFPLLPKLDDVQSLHQPNRPLLRGHWFAVALIGHNYASAAHARVEFPQAEDHLISIARLGEQITAARLLAPLLLSDAFVGGLRAIHLSQGCGFAGH